MLGDTWYVFLLKLYSYSTPASFCNCVAIKTQNNDTKWKRAYLEIPFWGAFKWDWTFNWFCRIWILVFQTQSHRILRQKFTTVAAGRGLCFLTHRNWDNPCMNKVRFRKIQSSDKAIHYWMLKYLKLSLILNFGWLLRIIKICR